MRLLIKNAKLLTPDNTFRETDVYIDYGEIIQTDDSFDPDVPEYIDAKGHLLLPGLIDVNCKICDPGYEYVEDIGTVSKSAVKGGFTTIVASPDTNPVIDDKTVVTYIESKSRRISLANVFQYGSMTKKMEGLEIAEIGEMKKAGIVGVSDGGISLSNAELMRNIFKYSIMFDLPVITNCSDSNLSNGGVINQGLVSVQTGLKGIPREAEEIIVSRNIILAKYTGCKLHLSNISTRGSVDIIRQAKKEGQNVTCDTAPHYFTLTEDAVLSYDTIAKVNPPLRTDDDKESIVEGLLDGTIDIIGSGHSPSTIEQKMTEFDKASNGISSLETTFLVSYNKLVTENKMPMTEFIKKFTQAPAKLLGLGSKGSIIPGYDADLILFDPTGDSVIDTNQFASKAKFSPFAGMKFKGRVLFTVVNGNIMYLQDY